MTPEAPPSLRIVFHYPCKRDAADKMIDRSGCTLEGQGGGQPLVHIVLARPSATLMASSSASPS